MSEGMSETWEELFDRWMLHDLGHESDDPPCEACRDIDQRIYEWVTSNKTRPR